MKSEDQGAGGGLVWVDIVRGWRLLWKSVGWGIEVRGRRWGRRCWRRWRGGMVVVLGNVGWEYGIGVCAAREFETLEEYCGRSGEERMVDCHAEKCVGFDEVMMSKACECWVAAGKTFRGSFKSLGQGAVGILWKGQQWTCIYFALLEICYRQHDPHVLSFTFIAILSLSLLHSQKDPPNMLPPPKRPPMHPRFVPKTHQNRQIVPRHLSSIHSS